MAEATLAGAGVLVTRPRDQAADLVTAIEARGGTAIRFPVIDIVPRSAEDIGNDLAELPSPDIAIFISRNAVQHGLPHIGETKIAAIGPSTATAVEASGKPVDIVPKDGFDSESLLGAPDLQNVAERNILIVRGGPGRELLADTLRSRGAAVHYLSVYDRRPAEPGPTAIARLESQWRTGDIDAITVMSVATLDNLLRLVPASCLERIQSTPLVTPSARVIKETLDRFPASKPVLASGPEAAAMVRAIVAVLRAY